VIQFDTSFLVDLQQELTNERPGAAWDFIEALGTNELLAISVHVVAELRVGAEHAKRALGSHESLDRFLSGFEILYPDDRFAPTYARAWVAIKRSRRTVASMDLLIATAALVEDSPLVTRNVKDFSKIPGLRVLRY
jgi:tRNA(fMet)-specific endonuclease VapC